ncbi:hypothetical protein [Prevotella nigrescens]|uniref:hypothetical protein n=1 Tax=Prevotella nigrescens TaxID=28133 RepID=UPI0028809C4B|nr:hypothetical protein [Prevotella nigrescens]
MMWVRRQPASEQLLKSQRSYGNHRFGVTTNVASGLRQTSLRGYGNRRNGVTTNGVLGHIDTAVLWPREWRYSED